MFEMKDVRAGLSLVLSVDPEPRNPRIVDNNVFQIFIWTPGPGDPHGWPDRQTFLNAMAGNLKNSMLVPLSRQDTPRGPILFRAEKPEHLPAGYAFASSQSLCLALGVDEIHDGNRDEVMEQADMLFLTEIFAYENYVDGQVYSFRIFDRRGECLEERRDLYGEEYARHIAKEAFEQHLMSVHMYG